MNPYQDIFDSLSAAAPRFALSSAEERIARIRQLYRAADELCGGN